MPTKADTYRQMADHATANLTAQVIDWSKFQIGRASCRERVCLYV